LEYAKGGPPDDICGYDSGLRRGPGIFGSAQFVDTAWDASCTEDPSVPNYRRPNPKLREGMVLAIEPMVNQEADTKVSRKVDGGRGGWKMPAHFEHTVAIMNDGRGLDPAVTRSCLE